MYATDQYGLYPDMKNMKAILNIPNPRNFKKILQ